MQDMKRKISAIHQLGQDMEESMEEKIAQVTGLTYEQLKQFSRIGVMTDKVRTYYVLFYIPTRSLHYHLELQPLVFIHYHRFFKAMIKVVVHFLRLTHII